MIVKLPPSDGTLIVDSEVSVSGELLFGSLGATGFSQATANATIIARSAKIDLFILIYINLKLINRLGDIFNKFSFERQS